MRGRLAAYSFVLLLAGVTGFSAGGPKVSTLKLDAELPSRGRLGGVSTDGKGNVYVSNFSASVWRIDGSGHVERLPVDLQGSSGNAVDHDGNLYQASFVDNRIVRIAPDGTSLTYVSEALDGPVGIAIAEDGTLYVCNCRGNDITRVGVDRKAVRWATSPDFDCPNGITIDRDGRPVVVNYKNGHVLKLSPDGTARRIATLPGNGAHVVATTDALYATQIAGNRVYRVGRDGTTGVYAGTGASGNEDGTALEAGLAHPNGIALAADGSALLVNTLVGTWRGEESTRITLRRIEIEPNLSQDGAPAATVTATE